MNKKINKFIQKRILLSDYNNGVLDLLKVCQRFEISVHLASFDNDNFSGALMRDNGSWRIIINKTDSRKRRRFTIAHELGHYISYMCESESLSAINDGNGILFDKAITTDEELPEYEKEAKEIAAEILMKNEDVEKLKDEAKNIEEMAKYFDVSESAMTMRLKDMKFVLIEG